MLVCVMYICLETNSGYTWMIDDRQLKYMRDDRDE